LEDTAYRISFEKVSLQKKRNHILKKNPTRFTELDRQLREIEFEKERINHQQQKAIRDAAFHQLEILIGKPFKDAVAIPGDMPEHEWTEKTLLPMYLQHSSRLLRMSNQLQILQQDAAIVELDDTPDLTVTGLVGNTDLNGVSGSNIGANLTFTYQFGGGEAEAGSAIRQDIASLSLQAEMEKQTVLLQLKKDLSQLRTFVKQLELAKLEYRLLEKQIQLKRREFKIGRLEQDQLIEQELDLQELHLNTTQRYVDVWFQFLTIFEKTRLSLADYLYSSVSSDQ